MLKKSVLWDTSFDMLDISKESEVLTMKTAYYTFYARETAVGEDQASGGEERLVRFVWSSPPRRCVQRENNVISMADYLSAQEENTLLDVDLLDTPQEPAPRTRTDHSLERLIRMEWIACAAIVCAGLFACAALFLL